MKKKDHKWTEEDFQPRKKINIAGGRARKAEMDAQQNKLNYEILLNKYPNLAEFRKEFDLEI